MHHVDVVSCTIALLAAFLVTASPVLRLPVGLPLAMWSLSDGTPLRVVAAAGSAAVAAGCLSLALGARVRRAGAPPRAQSAAGMLADRLARSSQYGGLTFSAAALPFIPARTLFPLLGVLRLPLRWALLGSFIGRLPFLLLTTWLVRGLARGFVSGNDAHAARTLAAVAIAWVVLGTLRRVDPVAWRSERRIRLRSDDEPRMATMFGSLGGDGMGSAGRWPGGSGPWATTGDAGGHPQQPLGEDEIEGFVVGEDDDEPGGQASGARSSLPPTPGS